MPLKLREAQKKRMVETELMDNVVLNLIKGYQNLTLKQIEEFFLKANLVGYSRSFLVNSLKRLETDKQIFSKTEESTIHGKLIKTYYNKSEEKLDVTSIKISRTIFDNLIQNIPTVYAIKNDEIILSYANNPKYYSQAVFDEPINYEKLDNEYYLVLIPQKFIEFYNLESKDCFLKKDYLADGIRLTKKSILKSIESTFKTSKHIVLLEDSKIFSKRLEETLAKEGHHVKTFVDEKLFIEYIQKHGKNIDVISLDKKIKSKIIADKLSYIIRSHAPDTKIGLLTADLSDKERKLYQDLNFDFTLKKQPKPKLGFKYIGDELVAWLKVI